MLVRALPWLLVAYLILVAMIFLMQRRLLYFPDKRVPDEEELGAAGLMFWPVPGEQYRGLQISQPLTPAQGTVIVFHGNAGSAVNRAHYVSALEPLGYRVVLAEYPGYGGRKGKISQNSLVDDAKETVRIAYRMYGKPVFLWGESLGGGVAAAVAADPRLINAGMVSGVVLLTPWDTLSDVAQATYWYMPAKWMLMDKYNSVKNLQGFDRPVAVIIAEDDEIIPKSHGINLYESLQSQKQLWVLENVGHNNWSRESGELWWAEVMEFVSVSNSVD